MAFRVIFFIQTALLICTISYGSMAETVLENLFKNLETPPVSSLQKTVVMPLPISVDLRTTTRQTLQTTMHNPDEQPATLSLLITGDNPLPLTEETQLLVDLGVLLPRWQTTGELGKNIEITSQHLIQIQAFPAEISGILMQAEESQPIQLQLQANQPLSQANYHLALQITAKGKILGENQFKLLTRHLYTDSDGDGKIDTEDADDDNDGLLDVWETATDLNPLNPNDAEAAKMRVDFEKLANRRPDLTITDQFAQTHGIEFSSSSRLVLLEVGRKPVGFITVYNAKGQRTRRQNQVNRPAPDADIGQFLLMAEKRGNQADLTLTFRHPVAYARGEILDIDGGEILTLSAWDKHEKLLKKQKLTRYSAQTGDGEATPWAFELDKPVIKKVTIQLGGNGVGVGFDNFAAGPLNLNRQEAVKPIAPPLPIAPIENPVAFNLEPLQINITPSSQDYHYSITLPAQLDKSLYFPVANPNPKNMTINLDFQQSAQATDKSTRFAIELGPLFSGWQQAGAEGKNIQVISDKTIQLKSFPAYIENLSLQPHEARPIEIKPIPASATAAIQIKNVIHYTLELVEGLTEQFDVAVTNFKDQKTEVTLQFAEKTDLVNQKLSTATADLGELFARWQASGGRGEHIQPIANSTQIKLLQMPAKIIDLPLQPQESKSITLRITVDENQFTSQSETSQSESPQSEMTDEAESAPYPLNAVQEAILNNLTVNWPTESSQKLAASPQVAKWLSKWPKKSQRLCLEIIPDEQVAQTGTLKYQFLEADQLSKTQKKNCRTYTDNQDGTVTANCNGLTWLKNANCIGSEYPQFDQTQSASSGSVSWVQARAFVAKLNQGQFPRCNQGYNDWRLPEVTEMQSLIDFRFTNPAIANSTGQQQWQAGDPFINVQNGSYWTATSDAENPQSVWRIRLDKGFIFPEQRSRHFFVWPVRGGNSTHFINKRR